jgi:hypothetical protein
VPLPADLSAVCLPCSLPPLSHLPLSVSSRIVVAGGVAAGADA